MRTVPLHGKIAAGRVALVSDHRYELVMQYRWYVWESSPGRARASRHGGPYAIANAGTSWRSRNLPKLGMHTLVAGRLYVDHIDGNGLNNQDENLRPCTTAQNAWNSRGQRTSTSAFKGVSWDRTRGKWTAHIHVDGHQRNLGRFASEIEAAQAYDEAARAAWGEFAWLNFPDAA